MTLKDLARRAAPVGLALALAAAAPAAVSAARPTPPETIPLAEAQLFISPWGEPFRSKAGEPYPVVAWFHQTDANHDGRIDRDEFRTGAEIYFHVLDRNGDGVLTDEDIYYYERNVVPEINAGIQSGALGLRSRLQPLFLRVQMGGSPQPSMGAGGDPDFSNEQKPKSGGEAEEPPQGAAPYELLNDPEPLRSADRSLSGRVTLKDFLARADHNFDTLDFEGRGYLTLEDLPRTPAQTVAVAARKR